MKGMLSAESAILLHFEAIGIVFLVLHGVVVSLLAFRTSECDFNAHERHLLKKLPPCITPAIRGFRGRPNYNGGHPKLKKAHKK